MEETTCCPRFDPAPWDGKSLEWKDKRFVKAKVFTICHMPVNFGKVVHEVMEKIEKAAASSPGWMGLSDHTSSWNMDLYVAVDKEVPGIENATMSGNFFSKVYEGPFKETRKWCNEFQALAKEKGLNIAKSFMWYTTCPKCAKKYGKNYVVFLGKTS